MIGVPGVTIHRLQRSCTAEVVALLRATAKPMTVADLRQATGWSAREISAALQKSVHRGHAVSLPSLDRRKDGKAYRWVFVEVRR